MPHFPVVVSADSHVLEPPDLWTRRLPGPHRKLAPRMVESERLGVCLIGPWKGPVSMSDASSPGERTVRPLGLADLLRGGSDVDARIEACDLDNISAELLYPTASLLLFSASDPDYRRACVAVYNDWLCELCARAPQRLFPLALLDVDDATWAVAELRRVHAMGCVGGIIPGRPPAGHYGEGRFDCLWRAAAEQHLPLSIHAFTQREAPDTLGSGIRAVGVMDTVTQVQRTLALLAVSGVLARFPELRVVLSEFDAGWVPHFCQRLDDVAQLSGPAASPAPEPPSAYVRRQVSFGFQKDRAAIELRAHLGPRSLLWGSDYPHVASSWPHSMDMLDALLAGVPDDERAAIVGGNAIALYGLTALMAVPADARP